MEIALIVILVLVFASLVVLQIYSMVLSERKDRRNETRHEQYMEIVRGNTDAINKSREVMVGFNAILQQLVNRIK